MSTKSESSERKPFKNWFDKEAAKALATQVSGVYPSFDKIKFVRLANRKLHELEFNERVQQFSDALAETLPTSIPTSLKILTRSLPPPLLDCEAVTDGWLQWPIGQFIANYGLDHFETSMHAMIELTQRFSSEFAVRPFVERYPERTFARMLELVGHSNPHVRRWCSEGVRPRLPWGRKLRTLVSDPTPIWPILDALKDDHEIYVRRSVANNLNDIAKDHPKLVVQRCTGWSKNSTKNRDWVIRHGLRSLIKAGDPASLALIGYFPPKKFSAKLTIRPKKIAIGDSVELKAELETASDCAQDLLLDYVVHFVRKSDRTSAKVFKWRSLQLPAHGSTTLTKRHPMKKTTVRTLYAGVHLIELQVNGQTCAQASFRLA